MASYVLKEMPDVHHEGNRKVFPKLETYSQKSLDDLVKYVRGHGAPFSAGTIEGVVTTLMEAAVVWLSNGHTVKIDGLGTLRPTIENAHGGADSPSDYNVNVHVEGVHVRFIPEGEKLDRITSRAMKEKCILRKTYEVTYNQALRMWRAAQAGDDQQDQPGQAENTAREENADEEKTS